MKEEKTTQVRVRLTIHGSERFFGPGICQLLEMIREKGSIQAAARDMEMSYTKAWKIINRAEKEMGVALTRRMNGGRNGGNTVLTEEGEEAVGRFREMERILQEESENLLRKYGRIFQCNPLSGT